MGTHQPHRRLRLAAEPAGGKPEISTPPTCSRFLTYDFFSFREVRRLEFSYDYKFPDPNGSGPRKWLKITDEDWIERFPNGVENKLRRQGSEVVDGDPGTVFVLGRDPDLLYFVPDIGSATLWVRDRRAAAEDEKWDFLGKMILPADNNSSNEFYQIHRAAIVRRFKPPPISSKKSRQIIYKVNNEI
jgi:hypothetical protein